MVLKHLSQTILSIGFESNDWDTGRAREVIDFLKTLPKGAKFYNPKEKAWRVNKQKAGNISTVYDLQRKKYTPVMDDDFDADAWLNDTFEQNTETI